MTRTKTIIGAFVLCALALGAFGAASAAASGGLTAVECVNVGAGNGNFNNNHCITPETVGGEYETVAIKPGVKKEVEGKDTYDKAKEGKEGHELGSTEKPGAIFHASVGGVLITVTCGTGNTTGGIIENTVEGEMKAHTTGAKVTWSECHASPETQPTKQCKVQGTNPAEPVGSIGTVALTATTGAEHKVTIKAEKEAFITKFNILKKPSTPECFLPEAGKDLEVTVTGEATAKANTATHSHLTFEEPWPCGGAGQPACGGLKANGGKAAQTETVTGFTKGLPDSTVGLTTESEIKKTES